MQAAPNRCKKQTVDPVASNSDTLDSAVNVYSIDIEYEEEYTHPCRSPTPTVNGCDLTPPTRTQTSEQE